MNTSLDSYLEIVEVIEDINVLHREFSYEIQDVLTFNLRRSVSRIVSGKEIDENFQMLVNEYKLALNANMIRFLEFQDRFPSVRIRIKQGESISEKLFYYKNKRENGRVPINKCLNDLLGFRLIVSNLGSVGEKIKLDNRLQKSISRMYPRSDGYYEALHLYFKNSNNRFFPWELQIWDVTQAELNEKSHEEHKQKRKYILLPQNYRDGNLEKEG
ncbi:hypothetical protein [Lactococcus petauri]|uniref:hypothetical protein n=1 Tax=Lactococcus petauri TaxID=1940789 RepID=UPI001F5AF0D3|nr:hypothetical protein [Lactococcus petauri]